MPDSLRNQYMWKFADFSYDEAKDAAHVDERYRVLHSKPTNEDIFTNFPLMVYLRIGRWTETMKIDKTSVGYIKYPMFIVAELIGRVGDRWAIIDGSCRGFDSSWTHLLRLHKINYSSRAIIFDLWQLFTK
ncbi:hypothetical protein RF11_01657 [Thelohanellus kitauei]|uniref:Uncharacterized protein n=1 Tax=Thelohanellus kitauei TaxID=669202 RepID=A0A0C2N8G7_THEKT|nr:hypothetical protein RF11_01657 [Thelohanellus kitauei]